MEMLSDLLALCAMKRLVIVVDASRKETVGTFHDFFVVRKNKLFNKRSSF